MNRLIVLALSGLLAGTTGAQTADAERGELVFQEHCTRCHIPVEIGLRVQGDWLGRSGAEMFQRIRATMPGENPGSLSEQQYLDVTAHVLRMGGAALPARSLPANELTALLISPAATATAVADEVPWRNFNGDLGANRYSTLDQINSGNVDQLEIAWRWSSAN